MLLGEEEIKAFINEPEVVNMLNKVNSQLLTHILRSCVNLQEHIFDNKLCSRRNLSTCWHTIIINGKLINVWSTGI